MAPVFPEESTGRRGHSFLNNQFPTSHPAEIKPFNGHGGGGWEDSTNQYQPMNSELKTIPAPQNASALRIMADRMNVEPDKLLATLKATVFKGATNEELLTLVVVANTYGLSPLLKELYAFPAKGGGIVPIVSIDGWLRIINDHPQMDGIKTTMEDGPDGQPISCTCEIYRKDRTHATIATEYLSECKRNTEPWKMSHRMLRHKAIIQCARIAFGFSGIHDEDEGAVIGERPVKGREIHAARALPLDPFAGTEDMAAEKAHAEWAESVAAQLVEGSAE